MTDGRLEPAASIIAKLGVDKVAFVTGKHVSRVYRWMSPKEKGGTGGLIPQGDQQAILQYAVENGIEMSPLEFFPKVASPSAVEARA